MKKSPAKAVHTLTENAINILERRYKSPKDKTIDDIFKRVARAVSEPEDDYESWEREFYIAMRETKFLPNSPCLRNAGAYEGSLSACYVIPIDDCMSDSTGSMTGIADAATAAIMVQKYGGGTGFSGARLRPKGDKIKSTHKAACGPIEVLKYLNAASNLVTQASFRAGANMFILPVHHPDILEFIDCKSEDPDAISRFNISVALTREFISAYNESRNYPLINPRTRKVVAEESAREVMARIAEAAWKTGDPGIFMIDLANERNPDGHLCKIEATNPCSEQALPPWGSCTLGSIDISKTIVDGKWDEEEFRRLIRLAVRFLDDVVSINTHPLPQISEQAYNDRRIGVDIMGWHDFLMQLGIPYDSNEALDMVDSVGSLFQQESLVASIQLANERGSYPWCSGSKKNGQVRNATRTTIAPTGTRSIIAGCSSGIEPRFGLANWRKFWDTSSETWETFTEPEISPAFLSHLESKNLYSEELIQYMADGGSLQDRIDIPEETKRVFKTAHEIRPEWHIAMQAAWQRYVDNAISKTINLPNVATPKDIEQAFVLAIREGCVSTTVYRDGCRDVQVLTNGKSHGTVDSEKHHNGRRRLPDERSSITRKFAVGGLEGYLTVGLFEDGQPGELFIKASKEGSTVSGVLDSLGIATSMALQHGVPLESLTYKMAGISYEPAGLTADPEIPVARSITDYVFRWMDKKFNNSNGLLPQASGVVCPECGGIATYKEGCLSCDNCSWSKCG